VTWCKVALRLARCYTVIAPDLRGYSDSGKPSHGTHHINYPKRAMAQDMAEVMASLGFNPFAVIGDDWGGAPRRASHVASLRKMPLPEHAFRQKSQVTCDTADH
jgi:pimeloyl-ACP methyl ester carboxylesterase